MKENNVVIDKSYENVEEAIEGQSKKDFFAKLP